MDEIMNLILEAYKNTGNNSYSGNTLTQVMENIRTQPHEISALFDYSGRKIYEHTSKCQSFDAFFVPIASIPHVFLSVHNHTDNITFSDTDLDTTRRFNLHVAIVVSPAKNYILIRPATGWPDAEWSEEYHDITQMILANHHFHQYDLAAARHLALTKVTQHYGIRYHVTDSTQNIIGSIIQC